MSDESPDQWRERIGVGQRQLPFGRHVGGTHVEPVLREDNGKVGGYHTHHWDGRQDATVTPDVSIIRPRTQEVAR